MAKMGKRVRPSLLPFLAMTALLLLLALSVVMVATSAQDEGTREQQSGEQHQQHQLTDNGNLHDRLLGGDVDGAEAAAISDADGDETGVHSYQRQEEQEQHVEPTNEVDETEGIQPPAAVVEADTDTLPDVTLEEGGVFDPPAPSEATGEDDSTTPDTIAPAQREEEVQEETVALPTDSTAAAATGEDEVWPGEEPPPAHADDAQQQQQEQDNEEERERDQGEEQQWPESEDEEGHDSIDEDHPAEPDPAAQVSHEQQEEEEESAANPPLRPSPDEGDKPEVGDEEPLPMDASTIDVVSDGGANNLANNEELRHFLAFIEKADRPATRDELSEYYYHALESLYVNHNISEFAERAIAGVAESGHSRLHFLLGVLYANGLGVVRSEARSLLHYTFAAIQGVPEAHVALGYRHRHGLGVQQDCSAAVMHLREAADAVAMTHNGRLNPRPLEQRAQTLFHSGPVDTFSLTERDRAQREATERARQLDANRFRMEQGLPEAALRLGIDYLHGTMGLRRDTRMAEKYLLRAVRMREEAGRGPIGDAFAYLGQIYAMGDPDARPTPIPVDMAKATEYFRRGVSAGSGLALNGLGYLHVVGYLQHDESPSERQRKLAEKKGAGESGSSSTDAEADRRPDFNTAASYFSRAVMLDKNAEAMYNLGVLHLHGRGVAMDRARAYRLFSDAANAGSMLSLWQLGLMAEADGQCNRAVHYYVLVTRYGSWHNHGVSAHSSSLPTGPEEKDGERGGKEEVEEVYRNEDAVDAADSDEHRRHAAAAAEKAHRVARHRRTLAEMQRIVVQRAMGYHQDSGKEGTATLFSFRRSPTDDASEPSVARLVEHLALAETGSVSAAREAAVLLDEDLSVADEATPDDTLVLNGIVEADHPSFAHDNRLPPHVVESAAVDTVVLQWRLPTSVLFRKRYGEEGGGEREREREGPGSRDGAVYAVPWLVSQREAKRLLLLRLLHLSAAESTQACLRLGDFYYYGESALMGSDAEVALQYYKLATRGNSARAYFNVGVMHQLGIGVPVLRQEEEFGSNDPRFRDLERMRRNNNAAASRTLHSPLMQVWVPGLTLTSAIARTQRARAAAASPNHVLHAVLRLLESTLHNKAPPSRVWRYEGGGGEADPAVDLVAAIAPSVDSPSAEHGHHSSSSSGGGQHSAFRRQYHYFYDLNLAKRAFDDCLLYSRGTAYFAVHIALVLLNLQWWALYYFGDVCKATVLRAAAKLAATTATVTTNTSPVGQALRLVNALLEGVTAELLLQLSGAASSLFSSGAGGADGTAGRRPTTASSSTHVGPKGVWDGFWYGMRLGYTVSEVVVLYGAILAFVVALVMHHHLG